MRVSCDNCGASYKIPDTKLTKEVNKATCRKCGHAMYIRRPDSPEPQQEVVAPAEESTLISNPHAAAQGKPAAPAEALSGPTRVTPPPPAPAPPPPAPRGLAAAASMPAAGSNRPGASPAAPAPAPVRAAERQWDLPPLPPSPEPTVPDGAAPAPLGSAGHDPRGDLGLALVGVGLGMLGLLLLVAAPIAPVLGAAGAFLGLLGVGITGMLLLTGGRGSRPASWGLSLGAAFVVALVGGVGAAMLASRSPAPAPSREIAASPTLPAPEPLPVPAEPAASAPAAVEPPAEKAAPSAAAPSPRPESPAPERIEPKAEARPEPKPKAEPRGESKPETKTASVKDSPAPAPEPAAAPALPLAAIDDMIKKDKGVRGCFYAAKEETGDLPRNVSLRISMQPTGKVSSSSIPGGEWKDTDFETCVVSAVRAISFPSFSGNATTFSYKFPVK